VEDTTDAVFNLENFFFEVTKPILENIKITYSGQFKDSQVVTNAVDNTFYYGSDNIIVGKLMDDKFKITLEGNSAFGNISKVITIPAVKNETKEATKKESYFERLWAYLTIKNLMKQLESSKSSKSSSIVITSFGNASTNPHDEMDPQEEILMLAQKYNFVTNFTSFVITEEDLTELTPEPIKSESHESGLDGEGETLHASLNSKSFPTYEDPNTCKGSLHLFSQTYLRGKELTIHRNQTDLQEFARLSTSLSVQGSS
jgi:hypothetical protein